MKCEGVEEGFGAEGVVDFCGCLGEIVHAVEVVGDGNMGEHSGEGKAEQSNQKENAHVSEVGDALLRRLKVRREEWRSILFGQRVDRRRQKRLCRARDRVRIQRR
jgi:hypothetical protein